MTPRPLLFALAAALALPPVAQAAKYAYHGDLMDGDAPATGAYDLRVRSFAQPGAAKTLGEATELADVALVEGRFSVELDLPEDADGTTWVEVAVRKAGSNDAYETLGDPQPVSKVNSTCPGAWALDGNSGIPVGSYLGTPENVTVNILSPFGVAINTSISLENATADLLVAAKSHGTDSNGEVAIRARGSNTGRVRVENTTGQLNLISDSAGITLTDGYNTATQNDGRAVLDVSGRLRSRAAGTGVSDTSGGLWFDDENALASFVGRGDNNSDWTGIFSNGIWRVVAPDIGGLLVNRTSFIGTLTDDMVITARPMPADPDADLVLESRSGQTGTMYITDTTGRLVLSSGAGVMALPMLGVGNGAVTNALEVTGDASKTTAGAWLANSDRRIKTAIAPIPNALDMIMKLRPVTFRYDDTYRKAHESIDDKRYYNVIAQEFAEVFPEAVKGSGEYLPGKAKSPENEILQVDTYPAQIASLAAIQELAMQDEALRDEVTTLKRENAALLQQLDALAHRLARLETRQER
jgi:hypothetical protein